MAAVRTTESVPENKTPAQTSPIINQRIQKVYFPIFITIFSESFYPPYIYLKSKNENKL